MSDKNIYQRINAVMKAVEYVQKDASVSTGGGTYKAVSHDMVIAVLRPAMVKEGIVVRLEQTSSEMLQLRGPDNKQHLYSASYVVDFVNIDTPADYVRISITSHANDGGDKAPGKAASYAVKYAMLKLFALETGENDESRMYEAPQYTELQLEEFNALLDKQDALGFAVFARKVGPDVMVALNRTFPDGKVSQGKKLCKELEFEGWNKLRAFATEIAQATDTGDEMYLSQLADELSADQKRVLAGILRPQDITALKNARLAA